jgi:ABC-2 type transport system permease protein
MIRWLKIVRAEFVRDVTTSLRYPVELGSGLIVMFLLFMGIYTGARSLLGAELEGVSIEQLIVRFSMWFLALIALNSVSIDIENEARQGTLEQILLCVPSLPGLIWLRAVVHTALGSLTVIVMALLLQLATGKWLHYDAGTLLAALPVTVVTIIGLQGFGMLLGGLSLVYKRIGQISSMIQFGFFFPAMSDLSGAHGVWRLLVQHLPLHSGTMILKDLFTAGTTPTEAYASLPQLLADSAVYIVVGTAIFLLLYRLALKRGTLAHY